MLELSSLRFWINNQKAFLELNRTDSSVNLIDDTFLGEFEQVLSILEQSTITHLFIQSAKNSNFCSGVNLEITRILSNCDIKSLILRGQQCISILQSFSFTTIAIVRGACLGGGFELALACDYIIAIDHPKTLFGLPEIKLGLIPCFGGLYNLKARTGIIHSLQSILSGKTYTPQRAIKLGLIDLIVSNLETITKQPEIVTSRLRSPHKPNTYPLFNFFVRLFLSHRSNHYPALKVISDEILLQKRRFSDPNSSIDLINTQCHHNLSHLFLVRKNFFKKVGTIANYARNQRLKEISPQVEIIKGKHGVAAEIVLHEEEQLPEVLAFYLSQKTPFIVTKQPVLRKIIRQINDLSHPKGLKLEIIIQEIVMLNKSQIIYTNNDFWELAAIIFGWVKPYEASPMKLSLEQLITFSKHEDQKEAILTNI